MKSMGLVLLATCSCGGVTQPSVGSEPDVQTANALLAAKKKKHSITVSPSSAVLAAGATLQFQATVKGSDQATWSASLGSVDNSGLYTAPAQTGSDTVIATIAGSQVHASATVTIIGSSGGGRDWNASPAIVDQSQPNIVYAMSDVHGAYQRMLTLLARAGLVAPAPATPAAIHWTGATAVLVVVGDLIDKGPQGVEVIDALIALEKSALTSGGQLVVTVGNHEVEFLVDPQNSKATGSDGFDQELSALGIVPEDVAAGREPRGAWLRQRPFAARLGPWFFAHAGNTGGSSLAQMDTAFRGAVDINDFNDPVFLGIDSILESRNWFAADATIGGRYAKAIPAKHIVFGHDPGSIAPKGAVGVVQNGALFKIDCGMSPDVNDSQGYLLRITHESGGDVVTAMAFDGTVSSIWKSN